jgi:methionyl-tRNA formyltransferase
MKVLICAYRSWAIDAAETIAWKTMTRNLNNFVAIVKTPDELVALTAREDWDMVILVGWSWKVPASITQTRFVIGMHPSDLPKYAGGSPIQNQVLDGLEESVASLFVVTEQFDAGDIIGKEPYSLQGHINDIFAELARVTTKLTQEAIERHPNHVRTPQSSLTGGFSRKRIKPEASQLSLDLGEVTVKQLWDEIRCREDPYPNAFVKDATGTLYFEHVRFVPHDSKQ